LGAFIKLYKNAGLSDAESRKAAEKSWNYVNSQEFKKILSEMEDLSEKQTKKLQELEAATKAHKNAKNKK
jgi:hypothetical protein